MVSLFVAAMSLLISPSIYALTATYSSFQWKTIGDYAWRDYNFDGDDEPDPVYTNVDWPVTMYFYGPNASVNNIKNILWISSGNTMSAYYHDLVNDTYGWSTDSGTKTNTLLDWNDFHVRLYALNNYRTPHQYSYYYVLGTSHWDLLQESQYSFPDIAADAALNKAAETVGQDHVFQNFLNLYNIEELRVEGFPIAHVWDHDGYARGVWME